MRKALEKGVPMDKVLETFQQEGKFKRKFYKKFLSKYEKRTRKEKNKKNKTKSFKPQTP